MKVGSSAVTPVAVMRRLNVRRSSQPRQAIPVSPGGNPTAVTTHR